IKDGLRPRLQDSVNLALRQGEGMCLVSWLDGQTWNDRLYSEKFACPVCGLSFPELEPRSFRASSPYGACPTCEGLGFAATGEEDELDLSKPCPSCGGRRLNPFSRGVTIAGAGIAEVLAMTVADAAAHLREVFQTLKTVGNGTADAAETAPVAERTVPPVLSRLDSLRELGLDYLTLDRPARTLSGGEFQRARLAASLGSGLTGVCYVLDEPTIGLHAADTQRLITALARLKEQGNTVLVVEHDVGLMRQADWLLDLGPGAGVDGGRLVAAGLPTDVAKHPDSQTARSLRNERAVPARRARRKIDPQRSLTVRGARLHNLRDLTVRFPLGALVCVTGVSGSGKSSLVSETLVPAVRRALAGEPLDGLPLDGLEGIAQLDRLVDVDQSPLGRSSRSNPATYSGVWDQVRRVFAQTRESRLRGHTARRFSFNARDGRCDACKGQGTRRIEMHFMPDVHVACPVCRGDRFNRATLAVRYAGKSVADVLRMRIDEAADFFRHFPKIAAVLATFSEVGLGYLQLGQSSLTLSGGEAQRVRLATELSRGGESRTLFLLDEPTRGLHPADIARLLGVLNGLVDRGHGVIVTEHQLDVIAAADWVIDLGPGSGRDGGRLIAEGTPEAVSRAKGSATGRALSAAR
ncbi:MAG: ABC-ATPase UvrA, partial [Planctomycetaceae bacterium]